MKNVNPVSISPSHPHIKNNFFFFKELNLIEDETSGPCGDFKIGDDDLQIYDFIRQFRLDIPETQYQGVTKVKGSNRMQTAYRLDREADLTLPTR